MNHKLIGIMDVGGGQRTVYSAGVYDYLLDNNIFLDYCIGVSAGSANLISYVARQRGRNKKFYTEYAFRREYMSFHNWITKKSYIDLDYIYSVLSNGSGEYPVDYDAFMQSKSEYVAVATEAFSGEPQYFSKSDIIRNDYSILKASSAIPVICKPHKVNGCVYYDGGVSDPFPFEKAFSDGCDKLIAVLTRPVEFRMKPQPLMPVINTVLSKMPQIIEEIANRHNKYNESVEQLIELEKQGRVLIVAPKDCFGVNTISKNKTAYEALYHAGYSDAEVIKRFI